jgi:hypothetical protein
VQTIFAAGEVNVVVWGVDDDVLGCNDLGSLSVQQRYARSEVKMRLRNGGEKKKKRKPRKRYEGRERMVMKGKCRFQKVNESLAAWPSNTRAL